MHRASLEAQLFLAPGETRGGVHVCVAINGTPPPCGVDSGSVCIPTTPVRANHCPPTPAPSGAANFPNRLSRRSPAGAKTEGTSIKPTVKTVGASPRARQFTERRRMAVWTHANACILTAHVDTITQTTHAYPLRNPAPIRTPSPAPSQTFSHFFHFLPCIRPFWRLRGYGKRTCLSRGNPLSSA